MQNLFVKAGGDFPLQLCLTSNSSRVKHEPHLALKNITRAILADWAESVFYLQGQIQSI